MILLRWFLIDDMEFCKTGNLHGRFGYELLLSLWVSGGMDTFEVICLLLVGDRQSTISFWETAFACASMNLF